jgi:hypothetical protein
LQFCIADFFVDTVTFYRVPSFTDSTRGLGHIPREEIQMTELNNLNDAIIILKSLRLNSANGAAAVWNKLHNAIKHLDNQAASILAE